MSTVYVMKVRRVTEASFVEKEGKILKNPNLARWRKVTIATFSDACSIFRSLCCDPYAEIVTDAYENRRGRGTRVIRTDSLTRTTSAYEAELQSKLLKGKEK